MMYEGRRRNRGRKKKRRKGKEFMDAALDGFIRDQALGKWREVDGLVGGANIDWEQAVGSSADFPEKGPYHQLWRRWWQERVMDQMGGTEKHLMALIEEAVRGAVLEERQERKDRHDSLLEDSASYKKFISRAMEQLLFESSGEIEEFE